MEKKGGKGANECINKIVVVCIDIVVIIHKKKLQEIIKP